MSYKKFLLAAVSITLCCILSSCGNLLPDDSSSSESSVSNDNLSTDSDPLVDVAPDQDRPTTMSDENLVLASLIRPDFLHITVAGFGVTTLLQDTEINEFLDSVENIQFRVTGDEVDLSTPGAITCTISIEYGGEDIQQITLPYFLHDGVVYVTDTGSIRRLGPFLDSDST